ncbi:MAG TPA: addiction module protein [Opitutaceae bacterium]|nr:addiction module protein [Opitutaceae bacterium]
MSIAEIKKMSTSERLAAMEQLWDAICSEDRQPSSPAWHESVLEGRRKRLASPDARFLTLDQIREKFR